MPWLHKIWMNTVKVKFDLVLNSTFYHSVISFFSHLHLWENLTCLTHSVFKLLHLSPILSSKDCWQCQEKLSLTFFTSISIIITREHSCTLCVLIPVWPTASLLHPQNAVSSPFPVFGLRLMIVYFLTLQ